MIINLPNDILLRSGEKLRSGGQIYDVKTYRSIMLTYVVCKDVEQALSLLLAVWS
jgi:hypothetical protein